MNAQSGEERIDIGADVTASDGEKVGTVAYVVVRPHDLHVTDIVVSTGAILGRDIVVPSDAVEGVSDGAVRLSMTREQVEGCPDYVEVHYRQPPEDWMPVSGFAYPAQSVIWPADAAAYPEPDSVTVNAPLGTVGMRAGMEVESSDGHKVGSIDALETDTASGDVVGLVVKQGILLTHDTVIPVSAVADVQTDKVTLKLARDEVRERFEKGESGAG